MSDIVDGAVKALGDRMAGQSIDGTVEFVIEDEGSLTINDTGVSAGSSGAADCTMTASADTFQSILEGELNPTTAFMSGRLKVDGDMGMAMKLGSILG
jgi:putative sterol carrier protein